MPLSSNPRRLLCWLTVTGGFLVLIGVVGVVLFVGKLLMTRGAAWVERSFNSEIADLAELANRQAAPESWLTDADANASKDEEARRQRLLARLDRAIHSVEKGRAFRAEARAFALPRLQQLRARWAEQTLAEIRAASAASAAAAREEAP
jgi:hypothetical protein